MDEIVLRPGETFEPDPHVRVFRVRGADSDATEELIATLTRQAREGDEAVAALARVRALHYRTIGLDGYTGMCAHCFHTEYPCETVRALDGSKDGA